jgi:hypothetical protein
LRRKVEKQQTKILDLSTEVEHCKRVNSTLVTLLRFKSTEIDFLKNPLKGGNPTDTRKLLQDLKEQERTLMSDLATQMQRMNKG